MSTTNREKRKQAKRKAREWSRGRGRTATKAALGGPAAPPAARFFGWDPEYHAAQDLETRRGLDQMHGEALLDREDAEYPGLYRKLAAGLSEGRPPTYLRFGRIPPGGRSRIWGPAPTTHEKGASVFAGRFTGDGHYLLDLDNTLQHTLVLMVAEKKAYFARGRRVGSGINGEPLLRDVDYTEPIPDDCLVLTKTPSRGGVERTRLRGPPRGRPRPVALLRGGSMNLRRRLEDLERRPVQPRRGAPEARQRMVGFLSRIAGARQTGTVTEEIRAEMQSVGNQIRRRLDRGEGRR